MADLRGYKVGTPGQTGDSTWVGVHVDAFGNVYGTPAALAFAVTGRVFGTNAGVVTTPATHATAAIVYASPDHWVRVPDGTAIVPLSAQVVIEADGATQGEIAIMIAQNDVGNGTSSAADAGPISLNTAVPLSSNCVARQIGTSATAPTNPVELKRFSYAASGVNQLFTWSADGDGLYLPVVRGPGTFGVWMGGTTVTFFSTLVWLEFPESALTN